MAYQSEEQFFAEWEADVLEEAKTLLLDLTISASHADSAHGRLVSVYAAPAWVDGDKERYFVDITCVANGHIKVNWNELQVPLVIDGRVSHQKLTWTSLGHCRISGHSANRTISFEPIGPTPPLGKEGVDRRMRSSSSSPSHIETISIPVRQGDPPVHRAWAGPLGEEDDSVLATIPVVPQSDGLLCDAKIDLRNTLHPEIYASRQLPNGFRLNHNGRVVVTLSIKGEYFPDEINGIRLSALSPDGTEIPAHTPQLLERDGKALLEFAIPPDSVQAWCEHPQFVARAAVESDSPKMEGE